MPKNCRFFAAAGLWLGMCGTVLSAPSQRFLIERFGWEQGLPQSCVAAMTQTRDGYLWVGTFGGLARFDGRRFTRFDQENTPGLKSNQIKTLFEDSGGNLWIGTEDEGIALVSTNGNLNKVPVQPGSSRLEAICEDASGAVWLHVADTSSHSSTGHLVRFYQGSLLGWEAGTSHLRALIAEDSGLLWVGTDGRQTAVRPPRRARPAARSRSRASCRWAGWTSFWPADGAAIGAWLTVPFAGAGPTALTRPSKRAHTRGTS